MQLVILGSLRSVTNGGRQLGIGLVVFRNREAHPIFCLVSRAVCYFLL